MFFVLEFGIGNSEFVIWRKIFEGKMVQKTQVKHLGIISLTTLLIVLTSMDMVLPSVTADFYIAPSGKDKNDGTLDKPFATLSRARDAVRELKKTKKDGTITVFIRGGNYQIHETVVFGLEDSGSRNQTITYSAYPEEEPVFSSGVKISGWKKLKDYPPDLASAAQRKVWIAELPQIKKGKWRFFTLFEGDKMLSRARGKGWVPKGDPPEDWWMGVFASIEDKTTFGFPEGALRNWENLEDVEIRAFPAGYTMNILGLESVDEEKQVARTSVPATYPIRRWSRQGNRPSAWVENVLEALDEPGEWVLNTRQNRLYYWPKNDKPGENIIAPALTELIRVEGKIDLKGQHDIPVKNLVFKGLTFTHGDRDLWTKDDAGIQQSIVLLMSVASPTPVAPVYDLIFTVNITGYNDHCLIISDR
jgi:hypothetical protein